MAAGLKKYDKVRAHRPSQKLAVRDAINRSVMNFALDHTIHTMIPKNLENRKKVRRLIKDFVWACNNHGIATKKGDRFLKIKTFGMMNQLDDQLKEVLGPEIRCIDFINKFNSTWSELQKWVYEEATKKPQQT